MNIRIYTSFGIILHIICIIKGQQRIIFPTNNEDDNNCIHTSGQPGLCVLFPKCQRNLIGPDLNGNTCGFEGNTPKICCPNQNPKSGGVTLQVFSPELNFDCGKANLSDTYSHRHNYNWINTLLYQPTYGYTANVLPDGGFGPGGAIESDPNEWPWAVLVGVKLADPTWICTGSLINLKFILSAAHCQTRSPDIIRLGEHSILNDTDGANPVDKNIIRAIVNPHYETVPSYHDLVLFEMDLGSELYTFPKSINPICLPWSDSKQQNFINKKMIGVGWGATEYRGEFSDVLLKADVQSFDVNVCDESYKILPAYEINWPQGITEEFYICAGNQTANVDACGGDSGGPLMYKEGNKYFIGGVVSTGYGCGNGQFLGLYTNLKNTRYLQWIKDVAF